MVFMKALNVVLVLTIFTFATALPKEKRQLIPEYYNPLNPPLIFPDFYNQLGRRIQENNNAIMTRIQEQIDDARNNFPPFPKPLTPSEAGFVKPTNTSSVTKVINGQKVTVNETIYSKGKPGNDKNSHVFRIKTVDITPNKKGGSIESSIEISEEKHTKKSHKTSQESRETESESDESLEPEQASVETTAELLEAAGDV